MSKVGNHPKVQVKTDDECLVKTNDQFTLNRTKKGKVKTASRRKEFFQSKILNQGGFLTQAVVVARLSFVVITSK